MVKKLDDVMAALPAGRRAKIELRAQELASLKDLRQAVEKTQEDLAEVLGVGQDTISRLEQRSDMLLSTLRRYVEGMGGTLELVAQFPNRPPVVIEHLAKDKPPAPCGVKHASQALRHKLPSRNVNPAATTEWPLLYFRIMEWCHCCLTAPGLFTTFLPKITVDRGKSPKPLEIDLDTSLSLCAHFSQLTGNAFDSASEAGSPA